MKASELQCPRCFAPVDTRGGTISTCRYCGATVAVHAPAGAAPVVAPAPGALCLEQAGPNLISVIKVIREHTGLGLKEAKDLAEKAPCVVAQWGDAGRMAAFREALTKAGARTR
jgi:large subunit ribosomal protein L7/L12